MRISKQWIEDFVTLPKKSGEEMLEELTVQTVEVEEVVEQTAFLDGVVVGEILSIEKHENAEKLNIAQVEVGEKSPRQIVFGNKLEMHVGAKVPVALAPTVLPGGFAINKSKMRGETSEGMLCLDQELGLVDEGLSIQMFDAKVKNGTKIIKALKLDDTIFDIDNKSMTNRPDLWGHYGMAREFAAMYKTELKAYAPAEVVEGTEAAVKVKVKDQKLCPRYMGVQLSGITVEPSPTWMQKRLLAVGVRPINNIVDITSYVMFELGQPMHAFDADTIDVASVVVRKAKKGEKIVLLGGEEYELEPSMLLITEKKRAIAVAGVKGGDDSGVTDQSTSIMYEAANFEALSVRRTSTALGVRTDASTRFEKGLDPNLPELAMKRAVELTLELCPNAKVVSNLTDIHSFEQDLGPLEISADRIRSRIGVDISDKDMSELLTRLGFGVEQKEDTLYVTIPTWRATGDIGIPEDITEEVARSYGYKNIPTTFPAFPISPTPPSPLRDMKKRVKELLAYEAGYTEVYNYSFVSPEWLAKFGITTENYIELAHPLAKDRPFVRRGLIPNMMVNVESNLHRFDAVRLFETGRGYRPEEDGPLAHPDKKEMLPGQDEYLGLVYAEKGVETPFFELSGVLHNVADRLGLAITFEKADESPEYLHGGRHAFVKVGDTYLGSIAEIHPVVQDTIGVPHRTAVVQLNLSRLAPLVNERIAYTPLPAFPVVQRDLAFEVKSITADTDVRKAIAAVSPMITDVQLFDVYQGEHIADGKKSMAYRVTYRDDNKTLTGEEVDGEHAHVVAAVEKKFGAVVR
ncbi:MAG: phenylalanine--tRNA ligase subunit beta [Candidatus Magasanikbacteria bacterium]|jgi:phenylalanyl-tRNA synthetase beta chain|nr:phenylalanine--tRNA ligase subunit beta [Candidatus Magasanikbacteria bacterium]